MGSGSALSGYGVLITFDFISRPSATICAAVWQKRKRIVMISSPMIMLIFWMLAVKYRRGIFLLELPSWSVAIDRHAVEMPSLLLNGYLDGEKCRRTLTDINFAKTAAKNRITFADSANISVSCESIFHRGFYTDRPMSREEAELPIAYARVVFRDYYMQEAMFNVMFAPQNEFCYVIDKKASFEFHARMRNLSACFPNVHISEIEYSVSSDGENMIRSLLQCMRILVRYPKWKYVFLLQNHDLPLKTNAELVRILSVFNGSNDVEMKVPRASMNISWKFGSLNIFRDKRRNDDRRLYLVKGGVQSIFSRAYVEYILNTLNVSIFLNNLDNIKFGGDEMFFATLNMQDELGVPGGFTRRCLSSRPFYASKFAIWQHMGGCSSSKFRHAVCTFGIEDLPKLMNVSKLIANKMLPEFDYSAFSCWMQTLFNLTYGNLTRRLSLETYSRLPHVRFNRERERWMRNPTAFNCTYH
uniref:Uncharacterized protein n=1 Tax=Parascaris univalens TaxID=6257 RepID=A0A914ZZ31_PARUN